MVRILEKQYLFLHFDTGYQLLMSNRSKFGLILCLKDQLCVLLGSAEIQLAEDYSSVRVLELVPVT